MSILTRGRGAPSSQGDAPDSKPDESETLSWSTGPRWAVVLQVVIVAVVAFGSVVLRRRVPAVPDDSAYDGLLFARNALSIESGDWLGQYHQITLAKGPGYPLFIAGTHLAGLELKVAEQLVYLSAVGALALAVLVTTRRSWLATAAFVFLALDPSNFGVSSSLILRDNLFTSLGLLAITLTFLTTLGIVRRTRWMWVLLGALGAGAAVALYWLTREEGVTLLPPLALTVGGVLLAAWWSRRRTGPRAVPRRSSRPQLARAGLALGIMLITVAAPLLVVRAENSDHYGVALGNDMSEGSFLRAYADWSRVQAGERQYRIPITEAQRRALYRVSPAARELEPSLEAPDNQWRYFGCPSHVCEYGGGWMVWALRDAAALAGHFDDAPSAQAFFAQLSSEINAACDSGVLQCAPRLPASLQPIQRTSVGQWFQHFGSLSADLVTAKELYRLPGQFPEDEVFIPQEWRTEYAMAIDGIPVDDAAKAAQEEIFSGRMGQYQLLGDVYRVLVPLLLVGAVCGVAIAVVRTVRRSHQASSLLALALALAGAVLVRLVLLALIDASEYKAAIPRYQLPSYLLLISFGVVGIAVGVSYLRPNPRPTQVALRGEAPASGTTKGRLGPETGELSVQPLGSSTVSSEVGTGPELPEPGLVRGEQ